jgi:hypothetical protein
MLEIDESAVICDLAETYHIYDYRAYDASYIALLVTGLGPNSRIFKKMSGVDVDTTDLLLARIFDQINTLLWSYTEDGQKNCNHPESLVDLMTGQGKDKSEKEIVGFDTVEQFEIERQKILKGVV